MSIPSPQAATKSALWQSLASFQTAMSDNPSSGLPLPPSAGAAPGRNPEVSRWSPVIAKAVDRSPALIAIFSEPNLRLEYLNPAGTRCLCPDPAAALPALALPQMVGVGSQERFRNEIMVRLAVVGTWSGQLTLRDRSGLEMPVLAVLSRHPVENGSVLCLQAVHHESFKVSAMLASDQELLHALLESSPDAIYFKDLHSRFVRVSRALAEKDGLQNPESLIGRTDFDRFASGHAQEAYFQEQEIIRTGQPVIAADEQMVWPDGRVRWASTTKMPLRDRNGQIVGTIGISRDITERRRLEDQLLQAQKIEAIGHLAGGIAHDFNNFLAVVQMQCSLLLHEPENVTTVKEGVEQISSVAECAARLTRQLLTFSRRGVRETKELDLAEIVQSMTNLLHPVLGEDIDLETRFAPGLPRIQADPGMMEQVLMNLALNARDAMPEGGRLLIALDPITVDSKRAVLHAGVAPGAFLCLSVADNGRGIPEEDLPRIFEPFFTTKEVGKGTGFGLATVVGIARQHHGWIEVESKVGQGSTFRIFLPAEFAPGERAKAPSGVPPVAGGSETILLVEDEPALRRLVSQILQREGYRLIVAESAAAALQLPADIIASVDLVFTDLVMPGGVSGRQLADHLRKDRPQLKIIFTSGYSEDLANGLILAAPGRDTFLQKPFSAGALRRVVREHLDE
jgi:PAS domain S-box-containing protein